MKIITSSDLVGEYCSSVRKSGKKIAFVPTMGKIHDGHLKLIEDGKRVADMVIASIFVNPKQFSANEDFGSYPRTFEADCEKFESVGVDAVYHPSSVEDVYGDKEFSIRFAVPKTMECLCALSRPEFFPGIMAVVYKLFSIVKADYTVFGEKDYQQYLIIKSLVDSLGLDTEIVLSNIVRNDDGVALSSRNSYFSPDVLKGVLPLINQVLKDIVCDISSGKNELVAGVIEKYSSILKGAGFTIDYLEIRKNADLTLVEKLCDTLESRVFFGGYLEDIRLIDNMLISDR